MVWFKDIKIFWEKWNNLWKHCPFYTEQNRKTPSNFGKFYAQSKLFKVWECLAKVPLPKSKKRRIGSKPTYCIFIRYAHSDMNRFLKIEYNSVLESKNAENY